MFGFVIIYRFITIEKIDRSVLRTKNITFSDMRI